MSGTYVAFVGGGHSYSGSEVKIDDKEYLIMREDDVLAILE
jgi:co-chaperonin GroES (HSP10)